MTVLRFCFLLVSVLAASSIAAAPEAEAGKKNDTLVWATDRDNPIADPFFLNTRELVVIGHHAWDTLVIIDPKTADIRPLLATKWSWVNPTTLEMELRKDVTFHSGAPMDADDVVYTLNFVSNKENAISNFALLAWIKSAERIDRYNVRIHLHNPFPPALAYLAGLGFIMQKGHYDNAPARPDGKKDFGAVPPNGTGPYKITEVKPGQHILMERNAATSRRLQAPTISKGHVPHHQGWQHARRRIDDRRHRLALDAPRPGRAAASQSSPVVENAKTLRVSYLQSDAMGTSGQKILHRQASGRPSHMPSTASR